MEYPLISFGTYRLKEKEIKTSLEYALNEGYRSIDTASLYANESFIGNFIKENEIPRQSLWITSKLNPKRNGLSKFPFDVKYSKGIILL